MNPELFTLTQIDWEFFATLTFKQEKLSDTVRIKMFFAWLRTQCEHGGIHFHKLLWFVRMERGELTGRKHFHALLAGFTSRHRTTTTCFAMMKDWEKHGGGMARVYQWSNSLDGVDYLLKELQAEAVKIREAGNFYEAQKFGGSCDLMLSKSLVTVLQARRPIGEMGLSSTTQSGVSK